MYTDADFSEKPHFECIALLPKSIGAGKTEEKYTIQPPPRFAQRDFFLSFHKHSQDLRQSSLCIGGGGGRYTQILQQRQPP